MVTFLIIAAALSIAVGLWLLNKNQNDGLNEINNNVHPFIDDLAPEATPAPVAEKIAKKKSTTKKKVTATKKPAKKTTKK